MEINNEFDINKDLIKTRLSDYLSSKGINTDKKFKCLNPAHADNNPSMSYDKKRNKVHCFSCGADYDIFDVIGIDYNCADNRQAFIKGMELYGYINQGKKVKREIKTEEEDFDVYFSKVQNNLKKDFSYLKERGISEKTAKAFGLGLDFGFKASFEKWTALIIPTGEKSFTARNTDKNAGKDNRIRKKGGSPVFNLKVFNDIQNNSPIFIVEGEIDAMSLYEVGAAAIALGSTANVKRLLAYFEKTNVTAKFVISLDNDEAGENAAAELAEGMERLKIGCRKIDISGGYNDPNEALVSDRKRFEKDVKIALEGGIEENETEKGIYLRSSAAYCLKNFFSERAEFSFIPTGFEKLDSLLDGGLHEGLYIIGAVSSLGKTTLVNQIADQTAKHGGDVLFVSLETSGRELVAKSISRLTLNGGLKCALTTREILGGLGNAITEKAAADFSVFAKHIFITEGFGDVGVSEIRETVKNHIIFTGNSPLVIIDYIQIMAPFNPEYARSTDKRNMDKNVTELKRLSRDFKIPIIGVSSFNRANYRVSVSMEAFKESGAIEYSADVLLGLQLKGQGKADFDVDAAKGRNPREVELKILKNRNGAAGQSVYFDYYAGFNYFKEI